MSRLTAFENKAFSKIKEHDEVLKYKADTAFMKEFAKGEAITTLK
jgi:hypothetical protein